MEPDSAAHQLAAELQRGLVGLLRGCEFTKCTSGVQLSLQVGRACWSEPLVLQQEGGQQALGAPGPGERSLASTAQR